MWELATATLVGIVVTGGAMLLRDDMLGARHARAVEANLRRDIAEIERRQEIYEADFKAILKELSELKGLLLSWTSKR